MALFLNTNTGVADLRLSPNSNGMYSNCPVTMNAILSTNIPGGEAIGSITINDATITITNLTFDNNPVTFPYTVDFSNPTVFGFDINPTSTPGNVDQFKIQFNLVGIGSYSFTYDITELDFQDSITIPNNTLPIDFGILAVGGVAPQSFVINNETFYKAGYSWFTDAPEVFFDTGSATINSRSTYTESVNWLPTFTNNFVSNGYKIYCDVDCGQVQYPIAGISFDLAYVGIIGAGYLQNAVNYNAITNTTGCVSLILSIAGLIPPGGYTIDDLIFTPSPGITISNASIDGSPLASSFPFIVDAAIQPVLEFDLSVTSGLVGASLGITFYVGGSFFDTTTVFISTYDIEIIKDSSLTTVTEFDFGTLPTGVSTSIPLLVGVPPYTFIYDLDINGLPLSAPFGNNFAGAITIGGGTFIAQDGYGNVSFSPTVAGSFSETQDFEMSVRAGALSTYSNPIYIRSIPVLGTATPPPPPFTGSASKKLVIANSISI
jgi:hypothetical protein